jgi:hypothetical protein
MSKSQLIKQIKGINNPSKILPCTIYMEVLRFLMTKEMTITEARSAVGTLTSDETINYLKRFK